MHDKFQTCSKRIEKINGKKVNECVEKYPIGSNDCAHGVMPQGNELIDQNTQNQKIEEDSLSLPPKDITL
jgi:hypothetical protein